MPLARISLREGRTPEDKRALIDGVYRALVEAFETPEDDRFIMVHEHGDDALSYGATYLGIERSDALVIIQITCSATRDTATKRRFYKRVTELLAERPGLRPQDVFINLVEVQPENWSFGNGEAQYA